MSNAQTTNEKNQVAAMTDNGAASTAGSSEQLAPQQQDQQQQQQQEQLEQPKSKMESFFALTKSLILRALIIYFVSSFFRRPQTTTTDTAEKTPTGKQIVAWNLFENGTIYDLQVWLSEDPDSVDFKKSTNLIWLQEDLAYGDWTSGPNHDGHYYHSLKIKTTPRMLNNGSIYMHTFITRSGESPNPYARNYAASSMNVQRHQLNKYKRIRVNRNYNLLAGEKEKLAVELEHANMKDTFASHWHPNLTINLVVDDARWTKGAVPPPIDEFVHFIDNGNRYLPILFINDYWNLRRDYYPINETTPELELHLTFQPLGMLKWQLYAAQQIKHKWTKNVMTDMLLTTGTSDDTEDDNQDSLKETLLDTNLYLLVLTIIISILHSVFELLAFKNDIQFWNNRKSLEGLSVRSVFFGVFQSLIVLLYVLDNETNLMIRLSCFVGLGIEVWKINKVVDISFNMNEKMLGIFPKLVFKDKGSYSASSTKEYDNLAFKYLGWVCFPLLVGYFIYSLLYNEHKGWYSFVLNMLYGYLLTFGFIMMTPQLFINYKLKSVAHMPWRMMTYKSLNTFIDDIFAFVIKMPTMYRLGCFRDDIIFFVFLYQRWQYRVDLKRMNEFGFSGEMEQEAAKNKLQNGTAAIKADVATEQQQQQQPNEQTKPKHLEDKKND